MRDEIDLATIDLVLKVQELEARAVAFKAHIKESFQLEYHARERPWAVFGLSMAAGALVGLVWWR